MKKNSEVRIQERCTEFRLRSTTASSSRSVPLLSVEASNFLNNAANNNRGIPIKPALTIPSNQVLGGILIRTDELVSPRQKIYGYSLFAPDVTCTPTTLLNVANSCFPTNTGTNGGINIAAPNLGAVFLESERRKTLLTTLI
ncbi:hypothetical protein WKK05_14775 [Nostoc sp. UHCC 0302]|uniref:hypothetical protein n=1 Tax=Nostoc sp. UHCC 0302 TaxID=3134896 RepID=UPI00311CAB4A